MKKISAEEANYYGHYPYEIGDNYSVLFPWRRTVWAEPDGDCKTGS